MLQLELIIFVCYLDPGRSLGSLRLENLASIDVPRHERGLAKPMRSDKMFETQARLESAAVLMVLLH